MPKKHGKKRKLVITVTGHDGDDGVKVDFDFIPPLDDAEESGFAEFATLLLKSLQAIIAEGSK